jgi:hypothetical protein
VITGWAQGVATLRNPDLITAGRVLTGLVTIPAAAGAGYVLADHPACRDPPRAAALLRP